MPRAGLTPERIISAAATVADEAGLDRFTLATGVTGLESLRAVSATYRRYALEHPGRYAASVLAHAPGDKEHNEVTNTALAVISAALQGYELEGADLIHAIRMWRAACHGIATLQSAGGFGLAESADVTFDYLIDALDIEFRRLGQQSR
jgi:hypothetical protein